MILGSEIRSKMRIGVVCGFLIGISFFVMEILSWFNAGEWGWLIPFAVFLLAVFIYENEAKKIPIIVAEVERELTKAKEQAKAGKFFCRYCGVENKKDAVYCEACGKKLS